MVEISPFCFLLLLKLAGGSGSFRTRRGVGTGVPLTSQGPRWLEAGRGGLCGGKSPLGAGHVQGEGATPAGQVGPPGAVASEQSPGETPQAEASPPWLQGLCPSTGGRWQLCGAWVAKTGLVCTLGALVAVGNGLVIAVIASSVSGWSHSSRLVLLSLAAADTALALLVVPLNLYRSLALGPGAEEEGAGAGGGEPSYCRAVAFVNSSLFGASLYSLAGVSLERYVAVFFPLHYRRLLSRRRVVLLIVAAWLLPVLLLLPLSVPGPGAVLQVRFSAAALLCEPDYGSNTAYSLLVAGTIFCPAAGTVTVANVRLWLAARAQCRRARVGARRRLPLLGPASRILLPVVVAFYACWAPCMGTILYNAVTHERVPEWVEFVALWLPTGSGFLNCFVYFWTNRSFRHKFQKAGQQLCCQARQEQHGHPRPPRLGAAAVGGAGTRPGSSCSGSSSLSLGCSQSPQPPLMALPGSSRALREVTLQGHAHRRGISAACNPQAGVDYGSGV